MKRTSWFYSSYLRTKRSRRTVVVNIPSIRSPVEMRTDQRYAPISVASSSRNILPIRRKYNIYRRRQTEGDARIVAPAFNASVLDIIVHKGSVSVPVARRLPRSGETFPSKCRVHCINLPSSPVRKDVRSPARYRAGETDPDSPRDTNMSKSTIIQSRAREYANEQRHGDHNRRWERNTRGLAEGRRGFAVRRARYISAEAPDQKSCPLQSKRTSHRTPISLSLASVTQLFDPLFLCNPIYLLSENRRAGSCDTPAFADLELIN